MTKTDPSLTMIHNFHSDISVFVSNDDSETVHQKTCLWMYEQILILMPFYSLSHELNELNIILSFAKVE